MRGKVFTIVCATIFAFFGASCGCEDGLFAQKNETSFVVNCDYGKYTQGKVTYLLGGSSVFFNRDEYDIETFVLGDVVTVEYTGEMTIRESSPSKIDLNGKIKNVSVVEAEILQVKYDGVNIVSVDGKQTYTFEETPQYVIKDGAGNFVALEEMQAGALLYATYRDNQVSGKTVTPDGLYAYLPRK